MDSAKYRNLSQYLKKMFYPEGFTKQDKTTLRKFAKKFLYDSKLESLLYVDNFKKIKIKKNLTSELHLANCFCKTCLFSDAFRVANVDLFREFYNNTLNACM